MLRLALPDVARELVERLDVLPTLAPISIHMADLLGRPRTSARDVANLLSADPAVAMRVLAAANSAQHGCVQRVVTLSHAVMVLGFNTVRNLVLALSLLDAVRRGTGWREGDQLRYWRHSIATGAVAKVLARRLGDARLEECFLLGLLHDVGRAMVRGWLPEASAHIDELVAQGRPRPEAERAVLGTDHAQLGAALLERWRLPPHYVDVVRAHHAPALAEDVRSASIVHVADCLAHAMNLSTEAGERAPRVAREAWAIVALDADGVRAVLRAAFEQLGECAALIGGLA